MTEQNKKPETDIKPFTEFETKYRVDVSTLINYKTIVENTPGLKKFIYIEGPDEYFVKETGFARYRKASHGLDGKRAEVTIKVKPEGAKNNIIRKEINWRVDHTPKEAILEGLSEMGFVFNFSIWKGCHIYNFEDATLVFYSVYDTTDGMETKKVDNFVEIEVNESLLEKLTEAQAWDIINKYERVLEPIGINPQKRLRKSLYEIYKRN